jgi:hypothetical protein
MVPARVENQLMANETTDDRSWWKRIYKAGIRADLDKQPRRPPDDLTEDQKEVWLTGYDR